MKFACRVVGHQRIQREGKDGSHDCKVTLRGQESKVRVEITIPEADRDQYPYGADAVLDFDVQQSVALVDGEGRPSRSRKAAAASAAAH